MNHQGTKVLKTDRLILRPFRISDAQKMYDNWASDPEVTRFLTWPTHTSVDVARKVLDHWVASYEKPDYYQWAICLKENDEPIGSMAVVDGDFRIGRAEIGYCISKRWWGKGITAEALQAVMDYLFGDVGMNRMEARHDVNNPNSGKVMQKCGLKMEGIFPDFGCNNQGVCDIAQYAILKKDWRQQI